MRQHRERPLSAVKAARDEIEQGSKDASDANAAEPNFLVLHEPYNRMFRAYPLFTTEETFTLADADLATLRRRMRESYLSFLSSSGGDFATVQLKAIPQPRDGGQPAQASGYALP